MFKCEGVNAVSRALPGQQRHNTLRLMGGPIRAAATVLLVVRTLLLFVVLATLFLVPLSLPWLLYHISGESRLGHDRRLTYLRMCSCDFPCARHGMFLKGDFGGGGGGVPALSEPGSGSG